MEITTKDFGLGAHLICLTNKAGDTLSLSNYGARIVDWTVNGKKIVLGFDSTQEYVEKITILVPQLAEQLAVSKTVK